MDIVRNDTVENRTLGGRPPVPVAVVHLCDAASRPAVAYSERTRIASSAVAVLMARAIAVAG